MSILNWILNKPRWLVLLSGLLLAASWPMMPTTFLIFIAWVPWLWFTNQVIKNKQSFKSWYWLSYAMLLLWNVLTTWWVCYADVGGGIAAIILNSFLMTVPLTAYYFMSKKKKPALSFASLIIFWVAFEKIHLTWEFTWPWLTLGNSFATQLYWIQWYEYTGHLGGSIWVWVVNILAFIAIKNYIQKKQIITGVFPLLAIVIPIIFSAILYKSEVNHINSVFNKPNVVNTLVVQPNIDPYTEKFVVGNQDLQISKFIELIETKISDSTNLVILPETAVPQAIWLNELNTDEGILPFKNLIKKYPKIKIILGVTLLKDVAKNETPTANELGKSRQYYDVYNASIILDSTNKFEYYIKSKLVPAVERMPYPAFFKFLEPLFINLGGVSGNLATQNNRSCLHAGFANVGTIICYESVYGSYVSEYVNQGANLLAIITNDGWWQNTPGHLQHLHYASLRAIETRREIARSANTGISCFINTLGETSQEQTFWKNGVIAAPLHLHNEKTFFVQYGKLFENFICYMSLLFFILIFIKHKSIDL